ncbi:hypothetical protein PTE30175_02618 [Pandoraea terrae]|uniref:DUF2891 domain-containing protein n=1 Tax=Pandoraea terrae TaxID=1537710 RepID=A0A5E4VIJ9_9BURK|nr:DUF2891 domain-containing protein [Pandoraea terrae]VVE12148.1 hypothetical protein PTE30175_02618 [Pandoraea terrae]
MTLPLTLTEDLAARFARIALGHVTREYPNHLAHALAGPEDVRTPRALHPVFFGSYDWHSCVHGYWMLAYLLRRFPQAVPAAEIGELFDAHLTRENVAGECAYFAPATARGFERPYGWAWLLKLAAELTCHEGRGWSEALTPLAEVIVEQFRAFLPKAAYPVRVGTHLNTAFALRMAADYAEAAKDPAFTELLANAANQWYGSDSDCPSWGEPNLDDFHSPALVEAECMRRLLPPARFHAWFDRFLPGVARCEPAVLFQPPTVTDRTDGKIAHLDGLNFSRAWCWRSVASALAPDDPRRAIAQTAAQRHLAAGLPHVAGDYMGEHWLATYAVVALEAGN